MPPIFYLCPAKIKVRTTYMDDSKPRTCNNSMNPYPRTENFCIASLRTQPKKGGLNR